VTGRKMTPDGEWGVGGAAMDEVTMEYDAVGRLEKMGLPPGDLPPETWSKR